MGHRSPGLTRGEGRIPRRSILDDPVAEQHLKKVIEVFAQPAGRTVARMIAAADDDSELSKAFRNHFIAARREEGRALLLRAIELGEIRAGLDVETALDMIYGALFFRLLLGHAPLNEALARQIVSEALGGMRLKQGVQQHRHMHRLAARSVEYLSAAAGAVRDHDRAAVRADGGKQTRLAHRHRHVVVLGFVAERARHPATEPSIARGLAPGMSASTSSTESIAPKAF